MDLASMFEETAKSTPQVTAESRQKREPDVIPDGAYTAKLIEFGCFTGNDRQRHWISFWFEIADGACTGKQVERFYQANDMTVSWLLGDMRKLLDRTPGWEGEIALNTGTPDEPVYRTGSLGQVLPGTVVAIKQRTTRKGANTYVDVFIDSLVAAAPNDPAPASNPTPVAGPANPEAPPPADADFMEDDIPF